MLQVEKRLAASQSTSEPQPRIEFDIPYRELKFTGVPAKSSVDIMPTVHRSPLLTYRPHTTRSSLLRCVLTVVLLSLCVVRVLLCRVWWRWMTSPLWCCP